jgi:anti-sigma factor RsiW
VGTAAEAGDQYEESREALDSLVKFIEKTTMTPSKPEDNSVLLVHAYLDGELDPANTLGISRQIVSDAALAAEAERVKALQQAIHQLLPREAAPSGLRARIEHSVGAARQDHRQWSWRALAASIRFNRYDHEHFDVACGRVTAAANHDCRLSRFRPHPRADGRGAGRCRLI